MAVRSPKLSEMQDQPTNAGEVLDVLKAHQGSKPLTFKELMDATGEGAPVLLDLLETMEESGEITTDGRGLTLTIKATGNAPKPAVKRAAPKPKAPSAEEKNKRVTEAAKPAPKPVEATPQVEEKQEESPAPVEEKDDTEYLRALIVGLQNERDTATNVRDGYTPPEEITSLPPRPEGVNENTWDMAHNAYGVSARDTATARLFWAERALSQV